MDIKVNLDAIKTLNRNVFCKGVEINSKAIKIAEGNDHQILNSSVSDDLPKRLESELTFTSGVLIHINPNKLKNVYRNLFNLSSKFILINDYPNELELLASDINQDNSINVLDIVMVVDLIFGGN